jgi:hypothetical protein
VLCDDGRTNYSSRLEEDPFPSGGGPTADYAFMLFFGAVVLWVRVRPCLLSLPAFVAGADVLVSWQVIGFLMEIPFLGTSLIFMILYVWSRRNPTQPVAIWGEQSLVFCPGSSSSSSHPPLDCRLQL